MKWNDILHCLCTVQIHMEGCNDHSKLRKGKASKKNGNKKKINFFKLLLVVGTGQKARPKTK